MSAEHLTFVKDGVLIQDAVVVHLICHAHGVAYKFCNGELYDNESTVDLKNPRVFCEACRLASFGTA